MEFRRSGDDRRRRVLRDEITGQDEPASIPLSSRRGATRRYSDGALAENQPRVTDFVPQRAYRLLVIALLLVTAVAAIETAYISLSVRSLLTREPRLAAFDLAARGNVGQWFASALLAVAAALSYIIYRLRTHRVDDFRGRYRVWLLAFALLLMGSLDLGTGVRQALSVLAEAVTSSPFLGHGDGWWIAIIAAALGTFGIRLAIEMRASRWATGFLGAAVVMFIPAACFTLGATTVTDPLERTVLHSGLWLLGHVALMLSIVSYARHVYLDAQGLLVESAAPTRKKKSRAKAKEEDSDSTDEDVKVSAKSTPAAKSTTAKTAPVVDDPAGDDGEEDEDDDLLADRSLSRTERKRLKKMQKQTRRAA